MKILSRLLLCILPPILVIIVVGSVVVLEVSNAGVNQQEQDFLLFKAQQLENYIASQWNLLVEFRLYYQQDLIRAAQDSVLEYAQGLISQREESDDSSLINRILPGLSSADAAGEVIFALSKSSSGDVTAIAFSTEEEFLISAEETDVLLSNGQNGDGISDFDIAIIDNTEHAYTSFLFEPFNWIVYVSESVDSFQRTQTIIRSISILVGVVVLIVATLVIIFLSITITRPLSQMSQSTQAIIHDIPEIKERLPIVYNDEGGILAQNFNSVFTALNRNYRELKKYTYNNIIIQKREARIKNIFQKYVPQKLIDRYIQRPESLLQSEHRDIAVLFMDIRNFTTISESMSPTDLVKMLNRFFDGVVAQINECGGHVDKYIGDAIMAVFGAPVSSGNDALAAVNAAIAIQKEIEIMNKSPNFAAYQEIRVGIGVHYGGAVVGNIGCDSKIEYTVIGDTVNLASRVESLCKSFQQSFLVSGEVIREVKKELPEDLAIRFVDRVTVKGKKKATNLYTIFHKHMYNSEMLRDYDAAIEHYFNQEFEQAIELLVRASKISPNDFLISVFLNRAKKLKDVDIPATWDGINVLNTKS